MTTCSKSLLIFILFAVLWLENKARHCGFPRDEKTHKTHKETTTSTASAATSRVTSAGIDSAEDVLNSYLGRTVCDLKTCKNGSEPFCMCALNYEAYFDHYPMSESGNCMDYLSNISTTPIYFYRFGSPCYKARNVCKCVVPVGKEKAQCMCNDECVSGCP